MKFGIAFIIGIVLAAVSLLSGCYNPRVCQICCEAEQVALDAQALYQAIEETEIAEENPELMHKAGQVLLQAQIAAQGCIDITCENPCD